GRAMKPTRRPEVESGPGRYEWPPEAAALLAWYRELFEFAPEAYVVTDLAGTILEANQAAAALLGRAKEFLPGKPLPFFVAPEDRQEVHTRLGRLSLGRETGEEWEVRLLPYRAEPRDAAASVGVSPGDGKRPARLRWVLRDVTARVRAERELRE